MRTSLTVWRKELIQSVRDGRTVFLTLALPLVMYPLMFAVIGRVEKMNDEHEETARLVVAIQGEEHAPLLRDALEAHPRVHVARVRMGAELVRSGAVHLLIEVPVDHQMRVLGGAESTLSVSHDTTRSLSRRALQAVTLALADYRLRLVEQTLERAGADVRVLRAGQVREVDVASAGAADMLILATMVPYLLVLLVASGASHTAIDTTAGEKERSTLETVLVSAASRTQVIAGKFMATWTWATLAGCMGFLGLVVSWWLPDSIWRQQTGSGGIPVSAGFVLVAMILPVSALLSAVFLALGCFARGAREGQTFASYVIIFVIMLAVLSIVIDVELPRAVFLIPIVGTTLVERQLLMGTAEVWPIVLSLGATLVVSVAALWLALKFFEDERVLFRP